MPATACLGLADAPVESFANLVRGPPAQPQGTGSSVGYRPIVPCLLGPSTHAGSPLTLRPRVREATGLHAHAVSPGNDALPRRLNGEHHGPRTATRPVERNPAHRLPAARRTPGRPTSMLPAPVQAASGDQEEQRVRQVLPALPQPMGGVLQAAPGALRRAGRLPRGPRPGTRGAPTRRHSSAARITSRLIELDAAARPSLTQFTPDHSPSM